MTQNDQNDDDLRLQVRKLEHLAEVLLSIVTKQGGILQAHGKSIESLAEVTGLQRRATNN